MHTCFGCLFPVHTHTLLHDKIRLHCTRSMMPTFLQSQSLNLLLFHLPIHLPLLSQRGKTKSIFCLFICWKTSRCPCVSVCVGVQLSHTALGNVMSPLWSEEGNRDSGLELQTLALLQAHTTNRLMGPAHLWHHQEMETLDAPLWIT